MKRTPLLSALLIAVLPGLAFAASLEKDKDVDSTTRVDKRQEAQERRIERGEKSGELTKKEANRLEKGQDRIDAAEKKAMSDGKMTKEERARIEKMQDKQARKIERQDSDKQERGAAARKSASAGASSAAAAGKLGTLSRADQDTFIRGEERKAEADGFVSKAERDRLKGFYDQVPNPERFRHYREPGERSRD